MREGISTKERAGQEESVNAGTDKGGSLQMGQQQVPGRNGLERRAEGPRKRISQGGEGGCGGGGGDTQN